MIDIYSGRVPFGELDAYRWQQLRARHGRVGTLLRIIKENLSASLYGLGTKLRMDKDAQRDKTDILLLQSSAKVVGLQRKRLLKEAIRAAGYRLEEVALDTPGALLRQRQFLPPPVVVPLRYYFYAAHAEWLVRRYAPRVLLNDRNGSLYCPFLRAALRRHHGVLVHLSHATTLEASRRLDMNDYDYYFLFGRSSLDALRARPLRFGTSTAVLTGSHMIDHSFDLPPPDPETRTILLLGVGPDKEREPGYVRTYKLIQDWAREHPEYRLIIKRHPRSTVPFWQETANTLANVSVLPAECTLAQALRQATLVINIMSNAVIEAALAGRPVIYCNLSDDRDIFSQEKFFGFSVSDTPAFQARIQAVEADFGRHREQALAFADFHLTHGFRGLEVTLLAIKCLMNDSPLAGDIERQVLHGTCRCEVA